MSQYDVCFLCDIMTLFAFSCELPLLPKGPFLITTGVCIFLPSCSALHSPLWVPSCCLTEAHGNLLRLWLQPSERLVLVLSWAKRLREVQTGFSRARAREHVFVPTALYGIISHCYCLHKKMIYRDTLTTDLCHCIKRPGSKLFMKIRSGVKASSK